MLLNDFNDADDDIDDADGRPYLMKTTRTKTTMFVVDGCFMLYVCIVVFCIFSFCISSVMWIQRRAGRLEADNGALECSNCQTSFNT